VGVEKLDIAENQDIDNVQTIREKSFIGHPDARCNFCGFMTTEFFNSHRLIHSLGAEQRALWRSVCVWSAIRKESSSSCSARKTGFSATTIRHRLNLLKNGAG
jgi:hypothetical protein